MAKAGWSLKPQVTMARRELYLALGKSAVSQAAIDELKAKAATLDARKSADQGRRPPGFPPRHLLHDPGHPDLSRDSRLGQRNDCTLAVQVFDCLVNGAIESGDVSEGLMSQIVRLQVVPDDLDIV
jgi:hypothetical protein